MLRFGYRISTDSKVVPSTARHNVLRVSPASQVISRAAVSSARKQRLRHLAADRNRKVGHLLRVGNQPAVVLMCQLLGPKRRQTQRREGLRAGRLVKVGQVSRRQRSPRCFEYQLLLHDRQASGQQGQDGPGGDRRRQRSIQPVHQAAMAGQDPAHVLDPEITLDLRLRQVAESRGGHYREAQ